MKNEGTKGTMALLALPGDGFYSLEPLIQGIASTSHLKIVLTGSAEKLLQQ